MYSGCTRRWPARGGVPLFFSRGGAPAAGELAVSLRGKAGAQLGREKATLGHSDHDPRALVVAGVFQVVGHGGWRLGGALPVARSRMLAPQ